MTAFSRRCGTQFGLGGQQAGVPPAEHGIAQIMVDLYLNFSKPLADKTMFAWHDMLMSGNRTIETIGAYRTHPEPMQVASGAIGQRKIHFEAPPSDRMAADMGSFVQWVQRYWAGRCSSAARHHAPRHRAFVLRQHPSFRGWEWPYCARARRKVLAQNLGQPTLISLALYDRTPEKGILRGP